MSEEFEQTLLIIPECYVYKIPPRSSASGYKAGDWDLTRPMWSGRLVVTSRGDLCIVRLENTTNGEIFAICPVEAGGVQTVEAVIDSSRYFVLRIEDGKGHHAFIGMGFTERNQAFDFSATLQDHTRHVQQAKEAKLNLQNLSQNQQDYSLKQGQTIHVNLKTKKPATAASPSKPATQISTGFSEGGGLLPPPPRAKPAARQAAPQQQPATGGWGDFVSGSSGPQFQAQQTFPQQSQQPQQYPFQQNPQLQNQPGFQPGFSQQPQQYPFQQNPQPQPQQGFQQGFAQPPQQQQQNQFRPVFQQTPQQFAPQQSPQFHPQP
eukprot:TRINITY_DN318_c0_g1_i1.p1 TRINITY_DN318_c0_g1~~TRINITY_DN318_c0_g1_i1.p1  ORF type:complete len:320 (+),score=108.43 TRINITY_DN318_c0_g1_i1:99-1058(+)